MDLVVMMAGDQNEDEDEDRHIVTYEEYAGPPVAGGTDLLVDGHLCRVAGFYVDPGKAQLVVRIKRNQKWIDEIEIGAGEVDDRSPRT